MARSQRIALIAILLLAAVLRLTGLDWDDYQHHHPDERYIAWVATTVEFPPLGEISRPENWQPTTSSFNPFHWPPEASSEGIVVLQGEPRDFAYGHVPLYLGVLATRVTERIAPFLTSVLPSDWLIVADVLNGAGRVEFHHLTAVGRALTALFDVGTVLFVFLLGRLLYSPGAGLLAAAFVAIAVLHIQLAHFFTSDPFMTFFVVAAIYFMAAAQTEVSQSARTGARRREVVNLSLAAIMTGLAIGSKFTSILLVLPLLWAAVTVEVTGRRWRMKALVLGVVLLTFVVTNPFAVIDWTCPPADASGILEGVRSTLSRSCYLQNITTQNAMVRGQLDLAFTRQYDVTMPYLYQMEMLIRWGLGPLLGIVGFAGLGWAIVTAWRSVRDSTEHGGWLGRSAHFPVFTVLLWVVPYLVLTGSFYVKFMRYMQPAVPFLLLFGAAMIWQWRSRGGRLVVVAACLVTGVAYAVSFVNIYQEEHPWNAASRWIYDNIPTGTMILSEQFDDYLPVTMRVDGIPRLRNEYPNVELTWLSNPDAADDETKLMSNLESMAEADYLTILSNRVYGVIPRQRDRYPLSGQYHQLLFDGELGYELVWAGDRSPSLFGVDLRADTFGWPGLRPPEGLAEYLGNRPKLSLGRVDESFIVYDQPVTMIFRNVDRLTAEQMRAAFITGGD